MAANMILVTSSQPLSKAFLKGNSIATVWSEHSRTTGYFSPRVSEPPTTTSVVQSPAGNPSPEDGVWPAGIGGSEVCTGVFVQPYAEGDDDSTFWMRLWGWRVTVDQDRGKPVWIPHLLAELSCQVGNITGPKDSGNSYGLLETERLCDTLMLTRGAADVYSNGSNLAAHAIIPLRGCQKLQFDFVMMGPPEPPITMNALWARF